MSFTNYNFIERASDLFYSGWKVIIDESYLNTGITFCKEKLIIMGTWNEWLWAHELTHAFINCK